MTRFHLAAAVAAIAVPFAVVQFLQNQQLKATLDARQSSAPLPDNSKTTQPPSTTQPNAATPPASTPISLRDILAQKDPMRRIQSLMDYVSHIPRDGIAAAISELQQGSPEWDRETKMIIHLLLTRWAAEDPDAAIASLNTIEASKRGEYASSILASIAANDPKRAAAWLDDPSNTLVDFPLIGHILAGSVGKEWVRQDPDAALAWAATLPQSQRAGAYFGILGTLAASDPAKSADIASSLPSGSDKNKLLADIGTAWARRSPDEAVAWASSLEGPERTTAMRGALGSWATTNPAKAAEFIQSLPPDSVTGPLLESVAEPWTVSAPKDAAAWVMAHPNEAARNDAIGNVMWNWTKQNPAEASTWLTNQPAGPARDEGIDGLALATFDNDPAGALTWAASISDESHRARSVGIGIAAWVKRDASSAAAWAARNNITLPAPSGN
jgi:hypothetical protein